ncbi:MAG TPA: hypothetical protein VGN72_05755 [Tepidisphaeraceae bacterium]|jgi:Tfp pilus assembly PilM family ATPase|nr:hypothetical protein [Tepidisphaeraceae bacterium]
MRIFKPLSTTRIGIDIGHHSIKAAAMRRDGARIVLTHAATLTLRTPGTFDTVEAQRLADLLRRRDFKPGPVAVVAPARALMCAVLELPPENGAAPIAQIARMEAARIHKQTPDAFEQMHWRLPVPARSNRAAPALSAVVPHAATRSVVGPLTAAGFDVAAVDGWIFAAARACQPLLGVAPAMTAILDMGASAARILLTIGETIASIREVPEAGIDQLLRSIAEDVTGDPFVAAELLKRYTVEPTAAPELEQSLSAYVASIEAEVTASFEYAAQQYPDSPTAKLILMGAGAALPQLAERLGAAFDRPVVAVTGEALADAAPITIDAPFSAAYTLALGAAQHPEAA